MHHFIQFFLFPFSLPNDPLTWTSTRPDGHYGHTNIAHPSRSRRVLRLLWWIFKYMNFYLFIALKKFFYAQMSSLTVSFISVVRTVYESHSYAEYQGIWQLSDFDQLINSKGHSDLRSFYQTLDFNRRTRYWIFWTTYRFEFPKYLLIPVIQDHNHQSTCRSHVVCIYLGGKIFFFKEIWIAL